MSLDIITGGINPKIEYFNVIKAPPSAVPIVDYIDDTVSSINNLHNKFFKFRYRFVYEDNEKSVWSAISKMPIPAKSTDDGSLTQGGFQNAINIEIQTGDVNVSKIEIAGSVSIENNWSDFFLIETLDKKRDNIESNIPYTYVFRNDSVYLPLDIQEVNLLFDYVPDEANALELANGNTLVVGGIKDGYNRDIKLDVTLTSINMSSPAEQSTLTASLAGPDGTGVFPGYKVYNQPFFAPASIEDVNIFAGTIIFSGTPQPGDEIKIKYPTRSTTLEIGDLGNVVRERSWVHDNIDLTVVVEPGWDISDIVRAFQTHPNKFSEGFWWDLTSPNGDVLARPRQPFFPIPEDAYTDSPYNPPFTIDPEILYFGAFITRTPPTTGVFRFDPRKWEIGTPTVSIKRAYSFNDSDVFPTLKWNGVYRYGLVYYDENGKTNGVFTNNSFILRTRKYDTSYIWTDITSPIILPENETCQMYIGHTPPPWAHYYHIVRTKELSCDLSLMVISPNVKFDDPQPGYMYFDIESIKKTNDKKPETSKVLNYNKTVFLDRDRIRIMQKLGEWTFDNHVDLPILDVVTIGTNENARQYIKVNKIDIPNGYINIEEEEKYIIEIYRPAKVLSDEDLIYYEIGESYSVLSDEYGVKYHSGQNIVDAAVLSTFDLNFSFIVFDAQTKLISILISNLVNPDEYKILNQGDKLRVTDSINNDGVYTISSISININRVSINILSARISITVIEPLINESHGSQSGIILEKITQPGKKYAYINLANDGDYYYRARIMNSDMNNTDNAAIYVADKNFNERYLSAVWGQGRPLIVDEDIKEEYYPAMLRFSQSYIYGTNINNTNRFYPNNFEEADASFGPILRLKTRENFIRLFQRFKTGMIPIYRQIIIDNAASSQVALSERLLNKPNYYSGEYGIDKYGSSLVSTDFGDYFVDTLNKAIVRVSLDGITNISDTYNLASWSNNNIAEDSYGYGCFNYENRNVIMLISINRELPLFPGVFLTVNNIVAYSESDKKFESFYGFTNAENMQFVNGFIFTGNDGKWYIHDNPVRNNFYGTQQSSSVTTVFNGNLQLKKTYTAIEELSNGLWTGTITTGPLTNQLSSVVAGDFAKTIGAYTINSKENKFNATIKRDQNSSGGKFLGDTMKGLYAQVALTNSLTTEQRLISVSLKYIPSPLTNS